MATTTKISFTVPGNLHKELRERIIRDQYGLRGKSRWVNEAIHQLLAISNFPELVSYNDEMSGLEKAETIVVSHQLKSELDAAVFKIRKIFPTLEGVQSRIIRTSILQRFLRS